MKVFVEIHTGDAPLDEAFLLYLLADLTQSPKSEYIFPSLPQYCLHSSKTNQILQTTKTMAVAGIVTAQ